MQKDEKVLNLIIDEYYGGIVSLGQVYTPERLPLSVRYHSPMGSIKGSRQSWMNYQNMPKSRALEGDYFTAGAASVAVLFLRGLAKAGTGPAKQEVANKVIASRFLKRRGFLMSPMSADRNIQFVKLS